MITNQWHHNFFSLESLVFMRATNVFNGSKVTSGWLENFEGSVVKICKLGVLCHMIRAYPNKNRIVEMLLLG